jgi:hypothetical protein
MAAISAWHCGWLCYARSFPLGSSSILQQLLDGTCIATYFLTSIIVIAYILLEYNFYILLHYYYYYYYYYSITVYYLLFVLALPYFMYLLLV